MVKKGNLMQRKNKLISKVSWTINSHPDEAHIYENDNWEMQTPVPPEILNIKLRGKQIELLPGVSNLTTPFIGNTFGEWMHCLYNGLNKKLIVAELSRCEITAIYNAISEYFDSNKRLQLVKDFESNNLKAKELLGNHYYFESSLKLQKGVWTYGVGS